MLKSKTILLEEEILTICSYPLALNKLAIVLKEHRCHTGNKEQPNSIKWYVKTLWFKFKTAYFSLGIFQSLQETSINQIFIEKH